MKHLIYEWLILLLIPIGVHASAIPDGQTPLPSQQEKIYHGRVMSLDVQHAELMEVLHILADVGNFRVAMHPWIALGKVKLSVTKVPWDYVLDLVLDQHHLRADFEGNILCIQPEQTAETLALREIPIIFQITDALTVEALPRLDLLAGVLSYTSRLNAKGAQTQSHPYMQAIHDLLGPYRDHTALRLAAWLTLQGVPTETLFALPLHWSPLPELTRQQAYSADILAQAYDPMILATFRLHLQDLAEQAHFLEFFEQYRSDLERRTREIIHGIDAPGSTAWFTDFFGWPGTAYHIVFAPAMLSEKGIGVHVATDEGEHLYVIIGGAWTSEQPLKFARGDDRVETIMYAWSQAGVDAALAPYRTRCEEGKLRELAAQAQADAVAFFADTISTAITILAVTELTENEDLRENLILRAEQQGLPLTRFTLARLRDYRAQRERYAHFEAFIPDLLTSYAQAKNDLLTSK